MSPASFVQKYLNASPQPVNPLYSTGQMTLVPSRLFRSISSLRSLISVRVDHEPALPPFTNLEKPGVYYALVSELVASPSAR